MHKSLEKLMGQKGLTLETLSDEEKKDFDRWNKVLSNTKITTENIRDFCVLQKELIESQWSDINNSTQKNDRFVLMHTIYSKIARITEADKVERESLERYLNQLIDTTTT